MLLAWLIFYVALQIARLHLKPFLSRLSSPRLLISLDIFSLSISTTTLNAAPRRLLDILPQIRSTRTRRTGSKRRLSWLYDTGALLALAGLVVAQVVLLLAAWRAAGAAAGLLLQGDLAETPAPRLLKRAPVSLDEFPVTPNPTQGLLIRPVLPGLTTSLCGLPVLFGSLLVAQLLHELGHGLAAAAEQIPLLSTGFRLFLLFFPTFHVEVALEPDVSPETDIRIASAGVWHNVLLASVAWTWSDAGAGLADRIGRTLGIWDMLDEGVIVVAVDSHSPLAPHLASGMLIDHVDDLELDAATARSADPARLWHDYLSSSDPLDRYQNLGWCLDADLFSTSTSGGAECCNKPNLGGVSTSAGPADVERLLCFEASTEGPDEFRSQACIDPLPLLPPTPSNEIPLRCLDDQSCRSVPGGSRAVCGRISEDEHVVLLGVRESSGSEASGGEAEDRRTVLWQGSRQRLLQDVTVTSRRPSYWFVPISLLLHLERLIRSTMSISLAIAFFNLLPLPHLDGSHILAAFFRSLLEPTLPTTFDPERRLLHATEMPAEDGVLSDIVKRLRRAGLARALAGRTAEAVLRRWTVGVGAVLLVATAVVELSVLL